MSQTKTSRRDFLNKGTLATGAVIAGAFGAPAKRVLGANDRINMALIGCGSRGMSWIANEVNRFKEDENVQISAVCDVWQNHLQAAENRMNRWFGSKPKSTTRYTDILAMDDIDAVGIATPDHAHSKILADAARAKKDAYCEKPMASNLPDARDALHAVNDNNVVCQIGVQRRSEGWHRGGAALIQSGVLGKISEVETAWHDASPRWLKNDYKGITDKDVDWNQYLMGQTDRAFDPMRFRCWHLWEDYTTGTPGLLGSHLIDVGLWFMDDPLPTRGVAMGGVYVWQDGREHADTLDCIIEYPKQFIINYSTRLGNSRWVPEAVFYGANGTFDTHSWTATGNGGGADKLKEEIKATPGKNENHVQNWLQCIRTREKTNAPVEVGYAHSVAAVMSYMSWKHGIRYSYDAKKEELVPDA